MPISNDIPPPAVPKPANEVASNRADQSGGTRLAVEFIIDLLAQGWTEKEILRNYPGLTRQDIQACLDIGVSDQNRLQRHPVATPPLPNAIVKVRQAVLVL